MSLVIVETLAQTPLTPENPTDVDYKILDCLGARLGTWQYSLLSGDRLRMLCVFEAPDTQAVRESYARAGGTFDRIWSAQQVLPPAPPESTDGSHWVVESTHPTDWSPEQWQSAQAALLARWAEAGVRWLKSYQALSHGQGFSELYASDRAVLENVHQQVGVPVSRLWPATLIKP